jgi:hypothetical protein
MAETYATIAKLGADSVALDPNARRDYLWRQISSFAEIAAADLRRLELDHPFLEQATVYVDDPFYRQGATAVVLEFRFSAEDEFTIGLACLVDHGSVTVRVTRPPQTSAFEAVRQLIDTRGALGYELQLRTIVPA